MNSNDILVQVNGLNSKIQNAEAGAADPTNASVVLAHGSTGTALKPLAVDANGHLEVNFTDEGGLATEAKQNDQLTKLIEIDTAIDSIDGKITKGNSATGVGDELQQVLIYGKKPDGTLQPLETNGDRLLVDVVELAASGQITTSTALASMQVCGFDTGTSQFKTVKVDGDGHLQVDVLSSVGGDTRIKGNDGADGTGTDRVILTDGNGALIVDPSKEGVVSADGTTSALHSMMLANNSGNLRTIKCDANGVVSVDGSASTQPVSGTVTANAGSGTFAVSAASLPLPSGAASEATLALAEGHLGTIDTSTAGIVASHYADGDTIGGTDTGVLIMGRNGTNAAKPIHITNNGDVEVEIADFVKGQATKVNSFPVVIASDQDTLAVEQSYSYSSEFTVLPSTTIANGANATSATFEVQSVKVEDPIITFTVDSGGSTNYDVLAKGSQDGTNFFNIGFAKSFFANEMSSTSDMGVKVPRYMQFNITNNHGSGTHDFTLKASGLGLTLATP